MWVVTDKLTGYSDESMRFAERIEAIAFMSRTGNRDGYELRFEFE